LPDSQALEATLPDQAAWNPSEIPSQTRSVSAFLRGLISVGSRFYAQVAGQLAEQRPEKDG